VEKLFESKLKTDEAGDSISILLEYEVRDALIIQLMMQEREVVEKDIEYNIEAMRNATGRIDHLVENVRSGIQIRDAINVLLKYHRAD